MDHALFDIEFGYQTSLCGLSTSAISWHYGCRKTRAVLPCDRDELARLRDAVIAALKVEREEQ